MALVSHSRFRLLDKKDLMALSPDVQEGHRDLKLRQVVPSLMPFPSLPGKDLGFVLFCLGFFFFFSPHVLNHTQHPHPGLPSVLHGSFTQVTFLYLQPPVCPLLASCGHIGVFSVPFLKSQTDPPVSSVQRRMQERERAKGF